MTRGYEMPLTIYFVEAGLGDAGVNSETVFYETEASARADAERMSAWRYAKATVSRITLQGPSAIVSLVNLLNREDYYDETDIIARYLQGKEVPK